MLNTHPDASSEPILKTDAGWRGQPTPEQYRVLRQHRTNRPGTRRGGHPGHIFPDAPRKTAGLRFCINGGAPKFKPEDG